MNNRNNFFGQLNVKSASTGAGMLMERMLQEAKPGEKERIINPYFRIETNDAGMATGIIPAIKLVLNREGKPVIETKEFNIFGNAIRIAGYKYRTSNGDQIWLPIPSTSKTGDAAAIETLESYRDIVKLMSLGRTFELIPRISNTKLNDALELSDEILAADVKYMTGINYIKNLLTDDTFKGTIYAFNKYLKAEEATINDYINILKGNVTKGEDIITSTANIDTPVEKSYTGRSIIGQEVNRGRGLSKQSNPWTDKVPEKNTVSFNFGGSGSSSNKASGNVLNLKKK